MSRLWSDPRERRPGMLSYHISTTPAIGRCSQNTACWRDVGYLERARTLTAVLSRKPMRVARCMTVRPAALKTGRRRRRHLAVPRAWFWQYVHPYDAVSNQDHRVSKGPDAMRRFARSWPPKLPARQRQHTTGRAAIRLTAALDLRCRAIMPSVNYQATGSTWLLP